MVDLTKLKVCYIAGTLGQGGAERQLFYAIQGLRQSGASVQVLALEQGGFWEGPIKELGAAVSCVGSERSRFQRICRIVKHLKKDRPSILQSQHFYTNAYAAVSSLILNRAGIGALRSNGLFDVTQSGRFGGRINLHLPRILAANSQSSIEFAIQHSVSPSRLFFLPNVVDTDRFKPASALPQEPLILLAAGRLTREKRFDRFISLLHRLRTNCGLDVRGWIVGPTRADQDLRSELERQAAALDLRSDVLRFLGSAADMSSIYQQANIFVLTSEHEGTPNVLLEAMASGLPVVATKVGGVPAIVQHERTGLLVDENDSRQLVEATRQLINNSDYRRKIGALGRSYVEETHSIHRLPAYLANLYSLALASRISRESEKEFRHGPAGKPAPQSLLNLAFRRSNDHQRLV